MKDQNFENSGRAMITFNSGKTAFVLAVALFFCLAGMTQAQIWFPQGPASIDGSPDIIFGLPLTESLPAEEVGALHVAAPHPHNPNTLYVGSVNGGVWVTFNAKSTKPVWLPLTDREEAQPITALEFDPTDFSNLTLVAGMGNFSSFGFTAQSQGLLRTTNGGFSWQAITGGGTLVDKRITGVAARGNTLVVSSDFANPFTFANIGIFRSTDGGATFTQIATGDGSATGLPGGISDDLIGDPSNPDRLYTSVIFADLIGGQNGIYRSDDTGATWTKVSTPAVDAFLISGATSNVEFAFGAQNTLYAGIVNFNPAGGSQLAEVFRSDDDGATWTALGVPGTVEDGFLIGAHPGGQGSLHFSIAADPQDPNLVYIGGDRQPFFTEASGNPAGAFFPNSIGALGFSGRIFRGDASASPVWTPLTHSATLNSTAPHADSRDMQFDADGKLLQTDDGGVYRHTNPQGVGDWTSVNGTLQTTEFHALEIDTNTQTLFGGTQDNGSPYQLSKNGFSWDAYQSADGGDTQIESTSQPGFSVRYGSSQFLGALSRSTWDGSNALQNVAFLALTPLDGADPLAPQFYTPIELNSQDPLRLVIGGGNGIYESLDQGDTLRAIGPGLVVNGGGFTPLAYGGGGNAEVVYAGVGASVFIRTGAHPAPLVASATFPGTGTVADISVDPADANRAYVATTNGVYETLDAGATWTDITGNLGAESNTPFLSVIFVPPRFFFDPDRVAVGTIDGVYGTDANSGFTSWDRAGVDAPVIGFPRVPVFDLDYDADRGRLYAGTLGRGAFKLQVVPFAGFLRVGPLD